jgi:hypothetical protein
MGKTCRYNTQAIQRWDTSPVQTISRTHMDPKITRNIMIDIESFGRRSTGLVVSIGAVAFSTNQEDVLTERIFSGKPEDEFHAVLNFDAAEQETRFGKEEEALIWWTQKQPVAYARLCEMMRASTLDVKGLITQFVNWLKPYCEQGCNVIGNSPRFDLVMIEHACQVTGVPFPVGYRSESDYRMLTDIVWGPTDKPRVGPNEGHDALFDAKFQAKVYADALISIQKWREFAEATRANRCD